MRFNQVLLQVAIAGQVSAIARDPGVSGPPLELVHEFYDEWPTGVAVSSTGRMFACYPLGLDANNTKYQVAELINRTAETPYPTTEINSPPGGPFNYSTTPPTSVNYADYLISVQSVYIDAKDRLWILDTGRAQTPDGNLLLATHGGPKIVGVNLTTNEVFQTITFPLDVAYPDSYLNDVRFDLRTTITESGEGVAYLTDSSFVGRNGIVVVDLGTGESWRHLDDLLWAKADVNFEVTIWGDTIQNQATGSDGITVSADGETLYFGVVSGRYIYSVPTARLLDSSSTNAQMRSLAAVNRLVQKGVSDGYEVDSNGYIYLGSFEANAINIFFPDNLTVSTFVRDPRIGWTDTLSVVSLPSNDSSSSATTGYVYFTENQLWRSERQKPYALFRVPLPDGGQKAVI
ncbi:hypothetical protein ASPZODRAFT_14362 [Penicilliopsis zonata CBS 506.65]|uniref:Major royal jelly protein n=1 Tax=Penicilliopsis zonata CBS 506.65 TaxID=1073090 RepID=A0A1L9SMC9_9EURO|nr:hypothetical protein ASPZODRAFT_14362 [Penicilliopsis zonata CBS 506.65]OJJ48214.1 hypothetical protein ASPZODRAFT_14362 [Penicilliopsis zonata CBS 506.65]